MICVYIPQLAPKEFTVKIVRRCVLLTVKHAEIQMDFALVRQAGWAQIALRVILISNDQFKLNCLRRVLTTRFHFEKVIFTKCFQIRLMIIGTFNCHFCFLLKFVKTALFSFYFTFGLFIYFSTNEMYNSNPSLTIFKFL